MKLKNVIYSCFLLSGLIFFNSCQEDTPGTGTTDDNPIITVSQASFSVDANAEFTVTVNGTKGSADLANLTLKSGGADVDANRITSITGVTAVNNPILLFGDDKSQFSYEYTIVAHNTGETLDYVFTLTDDDGLSNSATVSVTVAATPPSIVFNGSSPIQTVPNGLFTVNLDFVKGSNDIYALAILEDGFFIDEERAISYENGGTLYSPLEANYFEIPDAAEGATGVKLTLRANVNPGDHTITIRLEDVATQALQDEIEIVVSGGNQILAIEGVLFNSGGGTGTGGLDLDDGVGTGSADGTAEIKDEGLDDTIDPAVEENWLRKISGVNDTKLMYIVPGENGVSEDFSYESVTYKEILPTLWDDTQTFGVSNVINEGDLILANKGGKFYLLNVREVNSDFGTNDDNYVMDIKY